MAAFKDVILTLRTEKDFNQEQLAKALHVSKSTVGMWETGSRMPSPEKFEEIADYFNVDLDYLYGRSPIRRQVYFDKDGNEYRYKDNNSTVNEISTRMDILCPPGTLKNAVRITIGEEEATLHSEAICRLVKSIVDMEEADIELLADTAERISPKRKKNVIVVSNPGNQKTPPSAQDNGSLVPFPQYPTVTNKDIDEFAARNIKKKFTREEIAEMLYEMKQEDE